MRAQAPAQASRAALHLVMFDYVEARRLQPIAAVINYCSRDEVDVLVVGRTEHHPLTWLGSFAEPLLTAPPCSILALGRSSVHAVSICTRSHLVHRVQIQTAIDWRYWNRGEKLFLALDFHTAVFILLIDRVRQYQRIQHTRKRHIYRNQWNSMFFLRWGIDNGRSVE